MCTTTLARRLPLPRCRFAWKATLRQRGASAGDGRGCVYKEISPKISQSPLRHCPERAVDCLRQGRQGAGETSPKSYQTLNANKYFFKPN